MDARGRLHAARLPPPRPRGGFMNSLNSVLIEGNLVSDPEKKDLDSGAKLCTFTVATNRYFNQDNEKKSEVSFFDVEVWNKTAELCLKTLSKGRGVRVVGRLKQERWADKEGKNHSKVKVIGETVDFKTKFDKKPSDVPAEN
jgi:single-strand DNA-binding protein